VVSNVVHPPPKRKRSNADEHACKHLKDDIEMGKEEEGGQKIKGGRSGKKAKGMKKKEKHQVHTSTPASSIH